MIVDLETKIFKYMDWRGFREILRLTPDTVTFHRDQSIPWRDIVGFRAYPDFQFDLVQYALGFRNARLVLYLRDGRIISLRADLLVSGDSESTSKDPLPEAYRELVADIKRRVARWEGPKEEAVLMSVAWTLFILGGVAGSFIAANQQVGTVWGYVDYITLIGLPFSMLAFVIAPQVAKLLRRAYILSLVDK